MPWTSTTDNVLSSRRHAQQTFSTQQRQETQHTGAPPPFSVSSGPQHPTNISPNLRQFQDQQRSRRRGHRSEGMSDSSSGTEMTAVRESHHATTHSTQHPQVNAYMPHDPTHQNTFLRGPGGISGTTKTRPLNRQSEFKGSRALDSGIKPILPVFAQPMPKRNSTGFKPTMVN